MARLDLQSLRSFVAIAEERSIRKAAERLNISQPPLTRRLHALERLLGATLLVRSANGVQPTAEGEILLERARRLLADADDIEQGLHASAALGKRRLGAGISSGIPREAAAAIARAWKRALPRRRLEVRMDFTQALLPALRSGELALAIVGLPAELPGLRTREVYAEPMVAALPRGHPAARKKAVALADLQDGAFFWNRRAFNPSFHDACARFFRERGFRPRYVHVEPAQILTFERIAEGEGCTLVNNWRSRTRVAGVVYRPLEEGSRLCMRFATAWRDDGSDPDLAGLEAIAARVLAGAARRGAATRR